MNKQDILNLVDWKIAKVMVEEWNQEISLRTWSAGDRIKFLQYHETNKDREFYMATIAALSICDDAGKRIFDDKDIPALSEKSGNALQTVVEAALKLNGLYKEATDDAKKD